MRDLVEYDTIRYSRQMILPGWGEMGQIKLKSSSVFIAGAGGLGSPVSMYLALAGVGAITICDGDTVELANLNRQLLYSAADVGIAKATAAAETLVELNPAINIITRTENLEEKNIDQLIGQPDIVVDCLDNFSSRYLLNRYCIRKRIPLVHGAIYGWSGQVTVFAPPTTPCFRCIFPEPPVQAICPVVGVTPGIIGCIQATEVIKFIIGAGFSLTGRLLMFDGENMSFTLIDAGGPLSCPDCRDIL